MNLAKKITQILSLILLIALASSCKRQCFTTDEFDVSNASVDSFPKKDGIIGENYDAYTGGQVAEWHDTGLKSNGDMFLIRISGAWTPWNAGKYHSMNAAELNSLPVCTFCAKKDPLDPNCICYAQQNQVGEPFQTCDSDDLTQQNDPNICSCTKDPKYGSAVDYGTYHFPLNYFDKSETTKIADKQSACKYIAGMGAYIGLFGKNGVKQPSRLYHLFVDDRVDEDDDATKVCDIKLNSNRQCKDDLGVDRTAYIFKSANKRIFMRDDGEGNTSNNSDTSNDTYHTPGEVVKLKIFDLYYNDNYGSYNVDILKGVGEESDLSKQGLLEYLVRLVEDVLLGEIQKVETISQDEDGNNVTNKKYKRVGGIIEFMYKSIVQDSGFGLFVQVTLALYIAFFGVAVLLGTVSLDKKELMSRVLKISLVIFFTSADSWNFYNEIVVGFFYDSMNYLVSILMSLSDASLSKGMDTSALVVAQMDRAIDVSSSTRFSYIDSSIKMMLSQGFAGKVFSLAFSDLFGMIYIILIYLLVAYFIYVMLVAASMYLVNIMKIIFVLCLGPIFISFVLFNQTNSMFKNWLAFLGARSLEVVLIFAILYNFVMLIDAGFRDLLAFEACVEPFSFGGMFSINILKASGIGSRNVVTWLTSITKIAALIFITKLVLDKIATLAGHLIKIGGVDNKGSSGVGHGQSGMTLAGGMVGAAMGNIQSAVGNALKAGAYGAMYAGKGASAATRALGVDKALSKLGDYNVPMKFAREAARNQMMFNPMINKAKSDAASKNLSGPKAEEFIRQQAFKSLSQQRQLPQENAPKDAVFKPLMSTALGASDEKLSAQLDKKLIFEPASKFLKEEGEKLREQGLYGKDLEQQLTKNLMGWARESLMESSQKTLTDSLDKNNSDTSPSAKNLQSQIKSEGVMSTGQAAELYANDSKKQREYQQYLLGLESERNARNKDAQNGRSEGIGGFANWANNIASRGLDGVSRVTGFELESRNPNAALKSFVRQSKNEERGLSILTLNPINKSNTLELINPFSSSLTNRTNSSKQDALRNYLGKDHQVAEPLPTLSDKPTKKERNDYKEAKKNAGREDEKRNFFQGQLRELATKDLLKPVEKIARLERAGKLEDAAKAKSAMLTEARDALKMDPENKENFRKDGLTLFEKAARLDYLNSQFGISDSSLVRLSHALKDGIKKESDDLEQKVATGTKAENLKDKVSDLKLLKSGLLTQAKTDKEFDKLSSTLKNHLEQLTKDTRPVEKSLENGPIPEHKQFLEKAGKEIDQNKREGQEDLEKLDEKLKTAESKFEKEADERVQKQKEKEEEDKYQKDREKAMDDIFKIIVQVAHLKTNSGDESEIQKLEQNLKEKFAAEVEKRNEYKLDKLEKEVDATIANNSPEAVKKLEEEVRALAPITKSSSDSIISGLEAANVGITGNVTDALLKGDILKSLLEGSAANALLGAQNTPETGSLSESQKKDFGMQKNMLKGQIKLNNMNLKLKQYELDQLKTAKGDSNQIAKLEAEISDISKQIGHLEREEDKVEDTLKT